MLLGALMGVVAFTVYAWLDRNTSYWIGGAGRDHMFEWMAFARNRWRRVRRAVRLFIGCVIGIIEMPRFGAVLAGVTAGVLGATWILASGGSTEDFWGVLGILAIPAGAVIGSLQRRVGQSTTRTTTDSSGR